MEYISIKNLDKYQPHYRDKRKNIWVRWNIDSISDYKIFKLLPNQRWLFIGLICLACKTSNQIPYDLTWISEQIKYPKNHIPNDLKMLQTLELIVTNRNEALQDVTNVHLQTVQTVHNITIQNEVIAGFFNYFLLKTKKAFRLTPASRELIKQRLEDGFTIEQMKQAVDNFMQDDWADRHKHLDLIYCIGKQQGKPDNLEKWLNWKPKQERKMNPL